MRPSNRDHILDAAVRVIQREGVTAVTFDSVAAEAELTRGGIMYHFPSREDLLAAIHQHLADRWEASLLADAGRPAEQLTADERLAAYVRVSAQSATRAELQLMLEAATRPEWAAPWSSVLERWAPVPPDAGGADASMDRLVTRLAADGLWMFEALAYRAMPEAQRRAVTEHLVRAVGAPDRD
ncbi:transcriptional regulator, TetR family [Promicromonospora umidemergens]|uniref:TetR family transcriptional regulator n=1 Tax=Promicromonospora umidemergens TaxID=629679 RepID=A0ABP8WRS3_9MICO|nr:TetR/AcrR family transcriptional regulator [Promicromonospora umidemergens]MCP2283498.1 transcriptional regulator, TetR family [Promicromonospora umidemergens]